VAVDLLLVAISLAATGRDDLPQGCVTSDWERQVPQRFLELGRGPPSVHDLSIGPFLNDQGQLVEILEPRGKNRTDCATTGKQKGGLNKQEKITKPRRKTHGR
jgi:hypothetical protein